MFKDGAVEYTDSNTEIALADIEKMDADMGGTNIIWPLRIATNGVANKFKQARIFMLTDGRVENRQEVIEASKTGKDEIRIHTFGIGAGSDEFMCRKMAE